MSVVVLVTVDCARKTRLSRRTGAFPLLAPLPSLAPPPLSIHTRYTALLLICRELRLFPFRTTHAIYEGLRMRILGSFDGIVTLRTILNLDRSVRISLFWEILSFAWFGKLQDLPLRSFVWLGQSCWIAAW